MTRSEVATLLGICAAYDNRTVGDMDVQAWHAVIGDLPFEDSRTAVLQHYAETRERIMPADVRQRVQAMRRDRIERAQIEPPRDPDRPVEYRQEFHRRIAAIADGRVVPPALPAGHRGSEPTPEYRAARPDRDPQRQLALTVDCPWPACRARVGFPCVGPSGRPLTRQPAHPSRLEAAQQAAMGGAA